MGTDYYKLAANGSLTEDHLREFLKSSTIDEQNLNKCTLLTEAARKGHYEIVRFLLNHGADVNQRGSHGQTCLHYAVGAAQNQEETVQEILCKKPNIDGADDDGNTPLIVAVGQKSNLPVIRLLLAKQASPTVKNRNGKSARDIAQTKDDKVVRSVVLPKELSISRRLGLTFKLVDFLLFKLRYIGSGVLGVGYNVLFRLYSIAGKGKLGYPKKPDGGSEAESQIKLNRQADYGITGKGKFGYLKKVDREGEAESQIELNRQAEWNTQIEFDSQITETFGDPTTVEEFEASMNGFLDESPELGAFFAPGNDFFQKVAKKALARKHDPNNLLNSPGQIKDLTRLALYQPIFYCDDSGSMAIVDEGNKLDRQGLLRSIVTRISGIATLVVPDGNGAHLRFINKAESNPEEFKHLNKHEINQALDVAPASGTPIGTELRKKILNPFVFNVFKRGERLKRPIIIIVITDGIPGGEDQDTFKNAILECGQELAEHGYKPEAIRFLVSRVGRSAGAANFLESLSSDATLERVVHCTSDGRFMQLEENERNVEEWLLDVLMSPIRSLLKSS